MTKHNRDTADKPAANNRPEKSALTPDGLRQRVSLRVREYSDLTGVPVPSVYRHITNGTLLAKRLGNTLRIPVSEL